MWFYVKGSDRSAARESTLLLDGDVNRTFSVGPALAQRIEQQLRLDAEVRQWSFAWLLRGS